MWKLCVGKKVSFLSMLDGSSVSKWQIALKVQSLRRARGLGHLALHISPQVLGLFAVKT